MSVTDVIQRSFAGGEISPQMYGRIDDSKYGTGLETCLNFICLPQGPIQNRPGFEYVNEVKDSTKKVRLIPFTFNANQTMILELGDKYCRFHTQGKTLLDDDGAPYEIETPWEETDLFDLHYVQSADVLTVVHPSYAPVEIRRYGVTDWRVEEIEFGWKLSAPSSASAERATAAADDQNSEKYQFKYAVSALNSDKSEESAPTYTGEVTANLYAYGTTVRVSCSSVSGAKFYRFYKCQGGLYGYIGDSETTSIIDDDIDPDMSITPRRYDNPFVVAGGITAVRVTNTGSDYDVYQAGIARVGNYGYDSVGTSHELPFYVGSVSECSVYDEPENEDADNGPGTGASVEALLNTSGQITGFRILASGSDYIRPIVRCTTAEGVYRFPCDKDASAITLTVNDNSGSGAVLRPVINYDTGGISSVRIVSGGTGYTGPTITVGNYTQGSGATFSISYGSGNNWPAAVGYFEGRRCFAGLGQDPQRVLMSRSGTESDFTYSLPYRDDDRVSYQIATTQFNSIQHIVPLSEMLLMTTGSEVRCSAASASAIAPDDFRALPISYNGSSNVQPIMVGNNLIYCAGRGGHVLEFAYEYTAGGYISGDLCLRSAHLFDFREITDMTYSKSPYPILWFVSTSGQLLGLTYIPGQGIGSWHKHETDGRFESCACVSEDYEDVLYVSVLRNINGVDHRFIERLSTRKFEKLEDSFFVDCGGTYRGSPTKTVSGIDWLEGKEVAILADGAVQTRQIVHGGKIELEQEASVVHVGLPYVSDCKTLPVVLSTESTGIGMRKNVSKITLRVYESSGILAGPSFDERDLVEYKQRKTEQPGSAPSLVSGEIDLAMRPAWSDGGAVCIRQADPLPLSLLSMSLRLSV